MSTAAGAGDGSLTATTTVAYDAAGNRSTVDGPLSGSADTARTLYNANREVIGAIGPDPDGAGARLNAAQRITYGADGQPTKVEVGTTAGQGDSDWAAFSPSQQSVTTYDANGRKVADLAQAAGGSTYALTQYSYDTLGRGDCVAVRMNGAAWGSLPGSACTAQTAGADGPDRITKATYNAASEVTKVQTGYGVAGVQADDRTMTYNANGTAATLTDAEGNKTSLEYDGHDRLVKTIYPSTTKGAGTSNASDYEQLTYDASGNVTSRRLRDGQTIGYGYDYLNRIVTKDLPVGENDVTYAYDLLGHMTTAQTGGALTFAYDALGRNISATSPQGTISYSYDLAGNRTRTTWPGGSFYVDYDRLVTGEITALRENGATSGAGVLATYAYDNLGRRTSLTRGNGTVTSYGYDAISRLTSLAHDLAGTGSDVTTTFSYNPAGQIASRTRSNTAYAWTGAANVDRNYGTNGLNQYTSAGATAFGHDARGNLITSGSDSYGYSSENLLKTVPGGAALHYDPLLRLHTSGAAGRRLLSDGGILIAEYDLSNVLQARHVFGPGTDEALVSYDASGNRSWLIADERGSIVAKTDAGGAATAIRAYDEYGIPSGGDVGRFQYTGQAWLPELGMYYYKARMYSPTLGRFMQTDPIGYGDGMNMYAYVKNDPVNGRDPTGLYVDSNHMRPPRNPASADGTEDDIVVTGTRPRIIAELYDLTIPGIPMSPDSGETPQTHFIAVADEHTKNKRPSTQEKHEKGKARKGVDRGGEKGDERRRPPRIRPKNWKGPWPPLGIFPPLLIPEWLLDPCRYTSLALPSCENNDIAMNKLEWVG